MNKPNELILINVSDIKSEKVKWLWLNRIPVGKITLVQGDPGCGKSFLTCNIATAITLGQPIAGIGEPNEPGNVLMLNGEDGMGDTIRPRLEKMGANLTKIELLQGVKKANGKEEHFSLADDLSALEQALSIKNYALVVIDPLNAYLGKTDTFKDNSLRNVLTPLAKLAEKFSVAFVCVGHLTKGGRDKSIYRGQGSIAYVAAARCAFLVGNKNGERVFINNKNNLAPFAPSLAFEIDAESRFIWKGITTTTDAEILAPDDTGEEASAIEEAMEYLSDTLAYGEVESTKVISNGIKLGISIATLKRARERLNVKSRRDGFGGKWMMRLNAIVNTPLNDPIPDVPNNAEISIDNIETVFNN